MANRVLDVWLVKPKAATNLITNPSFETNSTGWTASGTSVTITRNNTIARRGLVSLEVLPVSNTASGAYFAISLTSGTTYTFSVDVKDVVGQTFNVYFASAGGTVLASTVWTGTGHWMRHSISYTAAASAGHRLYITRSAIASATHFYIDGAQLEIGNESTYFDGSSIGYNPRRRDYWWNGTPHASTSYRSAKTRTGGELVKLRDFASLLGVIGLGAAPVLNYALPSNASGAFYQSTKTTDREITLSVQFNGDNYGEIMTSRAAIVDAIDPNAVPDSEPLRMRVVTADSNGVWQSEMLDFPVHYAGGLEGATDPDFSQTMDRALMRFNLYLPYLTGDGETAVTLTQGTSLTNPWGVLFKDFDGQWKADARTTAFGDFAYTIIPSRNGDIYVGGTFQNASGNANADYIAKWTGAGYTSLGAWALNNTVYTGAEGPDGSLYFGGAFTNAAGAAAADGIFKWDGTSVTALGTGVSSGSVRTLATGADGSIYAGGSFPLMGGVADTVRVAKWDGTNWAAMGTGAPSGEVYTLATPTKGSTVIAGGSFPSMGGVANTKGIAKWTGTAWISIGEIGASGYVRSIRIFGGYVYAAGSFTTIGGVSTPQGLARWNGTAWENIPLPSTVQYAYVLHVADGSLYVTTKTSVYFSIYKLAGGKSPVPFDLDIDGAVSIESLATDPAGRLWLGIGGGLAYSATSSVVTVTNASGARSYPRFTITGPGALWYIKNETTGKAIYFDALWIPAGETITLDFQDNQFSFTSNWRGNMAEYVQQSSDFDFFLQNGDNNIAVYMTGDDANTRVIMYYTPGYTSIDKTER